MKQKKFGVFEFIKLFKFAAPLVNSIGTNIVCNFDVNKQKFYL